MSHGPARKYLKKRRKFESKKNFDPKLVLNWCRKYLRLKNVG
jgi:hypothetical protein